MDKRVVLLLAFMPPILIAPLAHADFAVNAGIGSSIIRDEDGTETFRGSDFASLVGFEWRVNRNFAIGFSVFNLGTASDTIGGIDTDIEVNGFDIHGRLIYPIGGASEVYGLLGAAAYNADVRPGGFSGLFGEDAWEIGGGVDVGLADNLAARFEARFLNGPKDESGGLFTIGLQYRF